MVGQSVCLSLFAIGGLCSCGLTNLPPIRGAAYSKRSFSLEHLPSNAPAPDASALSIAVLDGETPSLSVRASKVEGVKALTCRLRFDPRQWRAGELKPSQLWGEPDGVVSLAVEHEPGVVDIGIALAHWDKRAGISGLDVSGASELAPRTASAGQRAAFSIRPAAAHMPDWAGDH
jgi:hypothetical protein